MERETKEVTIQSHTFKGKTYATAREMNAIQSAYYKGVKLEVKGEVPSISEFDPAVQYDAQVEMIRQLVVEMDGSADNVADRAEGLPNDVFQELAGAIDQLIAKKKS